jgi:hypothetical protein
MSCDGNLKLNKRGNFIGLSVLQSYFSVSYRLIAAMPNKIAVYFHCSLAEAGRLG